MIKLFSFLGTNHYAKTRYYLEGDDGCFECETSFIQEALIDYLLQQMAADEKLEVTLLLTRLARSKNFEENKEAENTGFKAILKKYGEQVVVKTIDVEDGKNEMEIWENFNRITDSVQDGDVIHMDITHGFRSLPLLASAMLNFVKIAKSAVTIAGFYYGAFEAKDENNRTPILQLEEFLNIQNWSHAVDKFLSSGDSEVFDLLDYQIKQIRKKARAMETTINILNKIGKGLKKYISALKTNRVKETIKEALSVQALFLLLNKEEINTYITLRPFFKLLGKLEILIKDYRNDDLIFNVHLMAKQCLRFGLYQQVFTLVQENMLNCLMKDVYCEEDMFFDYNLRDEVSRYYRAISKNEKEVENAEKLNFYQQKISKIYTQKENYDLYSDGMRNDLNHASMKKDPLSVEKVMVLAKERIEKFERLFLLSEVKPELVEGLKRD